MSGQNTPEAGTGVYYLWHLEQIGCITETEPVTGADKHWQATPEWAPFLNPVGGCGVTPGVKVAIIDNGCATSHPNLAPYGDQPRVHNPIEFAAHVEGTLYAGASATDTAASDRFAGLTAKLVALGIDPIDVLPDGISERLAEVISGYLHADPAMAPRVLALPAPSERLAAHGTACAGLIAGAPQPETTATPNPAGIAYFGVNPIAQVIPIATVYSHAYWPLIMGLLYAVAQQADVILIPRAVENMAPPEEADLENDPRGSAFLSDTRRWNDKLLFESLLAKISARIPTVVAAGNSGTLALEYPAALVETTARSLIVAGAVTAMGEVATYSSGQPMNLADLNLGPVTVYGPSDDREETSQRHFRYSEISWRGRRLAMDAFLGAEDLFRPYSHYGVLALDIPGQYGYDAASEADLDFTETRNDPTAAAEFATPELLPRGLYTLFGGTSAASAITAGVVSLLKSTASGKALTGTEIKKLLERLSDQSQSDTGPGTPTATRPRGLNLAELMAMLE